MDKIEKIKKKIKTLLNDWKYGSSTEAKYRCEAYKELLEELDTFQVKPVIKDLQEAFDSYYDETWDEHGGRAMVVDGCHDIWFPSHATDDFFKAGAKWQKEQMMKDAVGGFVIEDIKEGNCDFLLSADYLPASMGLKDRQKVKVIVLKDE